MLWHIFSLSIIKLNYDFNWDKESDQRKDLIEVTVEGTTETGFKKRDPDKKGTKSYLDLIGSEKCDDIASGSFPFETFVYVFHSL